MSDSLSINGAGQEMSAPLDLVAKALGSDTADLEIWLTRGDGYVLSALVNAKYAFLVWMAPNCPEGWHSQNPEIAHPDENERAFMLANGQQDQFDPNDCVAREAVMQAFTDFWADGQKPPSIDWIYT